MIFRDQTELIQNKVNARWRGQIKSSEETTSESTPDAEPAKLEDTLAIVKSPKLNSEDGLINFFANNFTSRGKGTNLFWVPSHFGEILKNDSAKYSVQSVGAMALSRLQRSTHYYREAQKLYGIALLSLAELWRQHLVVDKDALMIATLFLGFFEVLASDLSSSRQSWMIHLGGLGFLLKTHKDQIQNTGFGVRMLVQSRSQVILNALQTKTPVPMEYQSLGYGIPQTEKPEIVQHGSAEILLIRLATLQAQYHTMGPSTTLIRQLASLDDDLYH